MLYYGGTIYESWICSSHWLFSHYQREVVGEPSTMTGSNKIGFSLFAGI